MRASSLLLLLGVCACARTYVERVGFDNVSDTVRYCGGEHASEDDILKTAREDCSASQSLRVLRCEREQIGAKGRALGAGKHLAVSSMSMESTYGTCCDFRCGQ